MCNLGFTFLAHPVVYNGLNEENVGSMLHIARKIIKHAVAYSGVGKNIVENGRVLVRRRI